MHLRGETQVNIQSIAEMNLSSIKMKNYSVTNDSVSTLHNITSTISNNISATVANYFTGGTSTHIKSPFVYMDDFISMANGSALSATPSTIAADFLKLPVSKPFQPASPIPELAIKAETLDGLVPAPVTRGTSVNVSCSPAKFSDGILSIDEEEPS